MVGQPTKPNFDPNYAQPPGPPPESYPYPPHTHHTPPRVRLRAACARCVKGGLYCDFQLGRFLDANLHANSTQTSTRTRRELDANSTRTPRESVVLKRDFGGFENQILRIIFQGRWGEPRHPFLPPHSHGCWCPWYQHSGRARACWENI